ncbi:MAG TPA: hypothetical protein VHU23_15300 [Rhizomicrobium sp.]|jgi:Flp pilus assembly protein TadG|nr:hypothetical protein [Rhizomicrobium sp.]
MKKSRLSRFWTATAGTAAIEFAFLALPFTGVATTGFEVARACWTLEALHESAIQGARCMGIHASSCSASGVYNEAVTIAHVQDVARGWGVSVPSTAISATEDASCGNVPGFAQIRISYTFSSVAGKLIPALNNLPLTASSCYPKNT